MKLQRVVVASSVLLVASLALSGCGASPTPPPTPAPDLNTAEAVWDRFYQAFLQKDVGALLEVYGEGAKQLVADPARGFGAGVFISDEGRQRANVDALFGRLTSDPEVYVATLDNGHTEDYKMASLVWSSVADGLLLVVESVVLRQRFGTWGVDFHVVYTDTEVAPGDPQGNQTECDENPYPLQNALPPLRWNYFACGHSIDEMLPVYASDAFLRSYDRAADSVRNATGPALIGELYNNSAVFNGTFPQSGTWDQFTYTECIHDECFSISYFVGPKTNDYPQFPQRYFSTTISDDSGDQAWEGLVRRQFLVRWDWNQTLGGAEGMMVV